MLDKSIEKEKLINFLKPAGDCKLINIEEGIQLSGMGYAVTAEAYQVPIEIHAIAKTDSTNIRLHYCKGQIIVNWEENPDDLPIHEPIFGHDYKVRGVGRIQKDTWVDIKWFITDHAMKVYIDNREVFSHSNEDEVITLGSGMPWIIPNYKGLTGVVGIGPAWGSTITVKELVINRL